MAFVSIIRNFPGERGQRVPGFILWQDPFASRRARRILGENILERVLR